MAKHSQLSNNSHLRILNVRILSAEKDGDDGILVRFSDGTVTGYVAEELLRLRPAREKDQEPKARNRGQKPATH
jgi:hypothetical protein